MTEGVPSALLCAQRAARAGGPWAVGRRFAPRPAGHVASSKWQAGDVMAHGPDIWHLAWLMAGEWGSVPCLGLESRIRGIYHLPARLLRPQAGHAPSRRFDGPRWLVAKEQGAVEGISQRKY
jgi:hypothetical protein